VSVRSDTPASAPTPTSVKIVIAGGFGVGKTTFIGAVSEIEPLSTEAAMTEVSSGVDDPAGVEQKTTTTVAFDFGRITLDDGIVLYLFGTPGQERFAFIWDDLVEGAMGAVALVDTRRIDQAYVALDFFEEAEIPFAVGVNHFSGSTRYDMEEIREALGIAERHPVVRCDAREKESVKQVILELLNSLIAKAS
jgi:uncharacterized protein